MPAAAWRDVVLVRVALLVRGLQRRPASPDAVPRSRFDLFPQGRRSEATWRVTEQTAGTAPPCGVPGHGDVAQSEAARGEPMKILPLQRPSARRHPHDRAHAAGLILLLGAATTSLPAGRTRRPQSPRSCAGQAWQHRPHWKTPAMTSPSGAIDPASSHPRRMSHRCRRPGPVPGRAERSGWQPAQLVGATRHRADLWPVHRAPLPFRAGHGHPAT
jgi:hypothetical protein